MPIIDLSLTSNLNKEIPKGPLEVNLGLYEDDLALSDPMRFHALQRAIDQYQWPTKEEIILFRQKGPLKNLIRPKERIERFEEWQSDHPEGDEELFARDLLVHFLELLMPSFPEESKLSVILEPKGYDKATFLRLAHPTSWVGLYNLKKEGSEVILLPPVDDQRLSSYEKVVALAEQFSLDSYVPEENLPLYWSEIDRIYVTYSVSNKAIRTLKGFEAAQGEVIF
ncbi:MAG: hypothetical protein NTY13_00630 [Chlamydiae bacterium]|nr:hypothetical protein [Chlamydiota bacterium]